MRVIDSSNAHLVMFVARVISDSSLFLISLPLAITLRFVVALTFATTSLVAKDKKKEHALEGSRKQYLQTKAERSKLFTMRKFAH